MCVCGVSIYRFLFLVACVTSHVCFCVGRECETTLCFGFVIVFVRSLLSHRVSLLSAQLMKRRGRASARASRTGGATVRSRCAVVSTPHTRANGPGETTLSKSKPPSISFAVMNNLCLFISGYKSGGSSKYCCSGCLCLEFGYFFVYFFICLFDFGLKLLF